MSQPDAARFAPIIYLDEREPFPPTRVGYSLITHTQPSPSFQRVIEIEPTFSLLPKGEGTGVRAARAIEYAVWSDWDIGHLFELEHLWVYLDAADSIVECEGSWHGFYNSLEVEGAPPLEDGHPVAYSQPGKHAFAASPDAFAAIRAEAERACTAEAGNASLLVTHLYLGKLQKNRDDDLLIRAYLQRRAFMPAWNFTRRFAITPDLLVPWHELEAYIPERIAWWLAQLRNGAQ